MALMSRLMLFSYHFLLQSVYNCCGYIDEIHAKQTEAGGHSKNLYSGSATGIPREQGSLAFWETSLVAIPHLRYGDEVRPEKHAGYAFQPQQSDSQGALAARDRPCGAERRKEDGCSSI